MNTLILDAQGQPITQFHATSELMEHLQYVTNPETLNERQSDIPKYIFPKWEENTPHWFLSNLANPQPTLGIHLPHSDSEINAYLLCNTWQMLNALLLSQHQPSQLITQLPSGVVTKPHLSYQQNQESILEELKQKFTGPKHYPIDTYRSTDHLNQNILGIRVRHKNQEFATHLPINNRKDIIPLLEQTQGTFFPTHYRQEIDAPDGFSIGDDFWIRQIKGLHGSYGAFTCYLHLPKVNIYKALHKYRNQK